ncbi:SDR family NAD(P)-dependent oxidoreductase [Geodermatophilus arenarius]|uniref:SDR family NAD(P)-dependent oxidoreductase n=1 Tax=Geodermatophilus arenarius TaxID=1137990 RepID=UPI0036DDC9FE
MAVVTGASSGIGAAIARALAKRGVEVHAVGRRAEGLDGLGSGVRPRILDLTDDAAIDTLAEEVMRLDVLVHCAGAISHGPIADAPVENLDRQYRANLRAPYTLTQALLPALCSGKGDVVFVNSSIYGNARAGVGQFAATQYGLAAIADALRDEVNGLGVRVLSVFPGRTATPRQARLHEAEGRPYRPERLLQPEDVAAAVLGALELPRTAEVTDVRIRPFFKW